MSSLLEALTRGREALRTADPTGQLWAACLTFLQQAQRFGVAAPATRRERAQRERRLDELAEQAGEVAGAILHYRAALAALSKHRRAPSPRATRPGPVGYQFGSRGHQWSPVAPGVAHGHRPTGVSDRSHPPRAGASAVRTLVIHALAHATAACGTRPR